MKYKYLYQTKDNENREGWIEAKDRADAYLLLRKQGIRPYRVIGDDPVRWQPWAIGAVTLILFVVSVWFGIVASMRETAEKRSVMSRRQIEGDETFLVEGIRDNWRSVLDTDLDRHLAAYVQPGRNIIPLEIGEDQYSGFVEDLTVAQNRSDDEREEVRQLKNIVEGLRNEMREYLANGGNVKDYFEFLEDRQLRECEIRAKAVETVMKATPNMRRRMWRNMNFRLREMGIAQIPEPGDMPKDAPLDADIGF